MNKPQLLMGLKIYYRAFTELNSCRSTGMTEGPIPWTAIAWWCQLNEVVGQQRRTIFRYVRQMDLAYLKFKSVKIPSGAK